MSDDQEQGLVQSFRIIKNEFERLEEHIIGNPAFGNPGLVGQIKMNERRINDIEEEIKEYSQKIDEIEKGQFKQKVVVATAAGAGGAIAGFFGKMGLTKLIAWFIH